jgi:hypothetical protein
MAGGVVFLCPVNMPDLKNPLIPRSNKHLLVKLGRLSQISELVKIIYGEKLCSAFSAGGYDFRGSNLGESLLP